jgi:hypothetical protein
MTGTRLHRLGDVPWAAWCSRWACGAPGYEGEARMTEGRPR